MQKLQWLDRSIHSSCEVGAGSPEHGMRPCASPAAGTCNEPRTSQIGSKWTSKWCDDDGEEDGEKEEEDYESELRTRQLRSKWTRQPQYKCWSQLKAFGEEDKYMCQLLSSSRKDLIGPRYQTMSKFGITFLSILCKTICHESSSGPLGQLLV